MNGEPRTLGLRDILREYLAHQESVIINRTKFDLAKAEKRAHILEGYLIAIANIEEVIRIIRASKSIPEAKENLRAAFPLSEEQAQAIVDMTLGKLTGMERQKIEEELLRLHKLIAELRAILADKNKIMEIVRNEMNEIKNKYSDARRTEIVEAEDDIILEDLIERHECVITLTGSGYIKRLPADTYSAQHRGGKGVIGMTTKEEDFVEKMLAVNSHSYLMLFTNTGKVHLRKAYQIPEASRTAKGTNVVNLVELESGEKITSLVSVPAFTEDEYLTMITKKGVIKRTLLTEYEYHRKGGKIALNLDEGDELLFVKRTHGECDIIIATHEGNAVRFSESNVRVMGRTARGVRGIALRGEDYVTGVAVVVEGEKLLTITENGYGKRTDFEDFRLMKNRGGHGVCVHNISEKTGLLAGIVSVSEDDDIMIITNQGQIVRTPAAGIPVYSRTASGVIVMRLSEGQSVANVTKLASEPEPEEVGTTAAPNAPADSEETPEESAAEGNDTDVEPSEGDGTEFASTEEPDSDTEI